MKKFQKLSRAEMKNVKGGLHSDPCEAGVPCTGTTQTGAPMEGTCNVSCACVNQETSGTFQSYSSCSSGGVE
jgi:hypothetical protein